MKLNRIILMITALLLAPGPVLAQPSQGQANGLFFSGTIEKVDLKQQRIQIQGQIYRFSRETVRITRNGRAAAPFLLREGDSVTGSYQGTEGSTRLLLSLEAEGA